MVLNALEEKRISEAKKILSLYMAHADYSFNFILPNNQPFFTDIDTAKPVISIKLMNMSAINYIASEGINGFVLGYYYDLITVSDWGMLFSAILKDKKIRNKSTNYNFIKSIYKLNSRKYTPINKHFREQFAHPQKYFDIYLKGHFNQTPLIRMNEAEKSEKDEEILQYKQYDRFINLINLKAGDEILIIGADWGNFAMYVASKFDIRIKYLTLTNYQFPYVKEVVRRFKLSEKISIKSINSLDELTALPTNHYNSIVVMQLGQNLDREHTQKLLEKSNELLKQNGVFISQQILLNKKMRGIYRKIINFVNKTMIFPEIPITFEIFDKIAISAGFKNDIYMDLSTNAEISYKNWRKAIENNFSVAAREVEISHIKSQVISFAAVEALLKSEILLQYQITLLKN